MLPDGIRRWLYQGHRPNLIARIVNRASAALFASGILPDYMATLEVTGRKSGRSVLLPVAMTAVEGQRYLVSMLGENVQWVKNVRASGGRAVLRKRGRHRVRLEEVPTYRRAPILKAYLQRAPGARSHIPVDKDASLSEFERVAPSFPVFHLVTDGDAVSGA